MAAQRRNDEFQSFSVFDSLTRPFRVAGDWFSQALGSNDRMQGDQSAVSMAIALLTLPFRMLFAFIVFMINSWAVSRHGYSFVLALPAMIAVFISLSGLWAANFLRETRSVAASQGYFDEMRNDSAFGPQIAQFFAEKLVTLKPKDPSYKYQLGWIREENGDFAGAKDIMDYLTRDPDDGYPDAHVWLARYTLRPDSDLSTEQRDEIAMRHFNLAVAKDSDNIFAQSSLSEFHQLKAKEHEKGSAQYRAEIELALQHLEPLVLGEELASKMFALPRVVPLLIELDQKEQANTYLTNIMKELLPIARQIPDEGRLWKAMVASCTGMEDFEQANQIITEAKRLAKDSEVQSMLDQLTTMVVLDQVKSFADMSNRDQYRARLNLLCEAITKHPRNREIYQQLLEFIAEKSNPDYNFQWLQESVISNPNKGVIHVLLGVHKISNGDVLGGQKHWRIAEQQFPLTQFVVNNMIDVAVADFPDDFDNMLDVVTLAIELFPNQSLLYQTRGVFYKKMGKYAEAIEDFQHATENMPRLLSLRTHLIDCYQELGELDQVEEQQRQIQTILAGLDGPERRDAEAALQQLN